MAENKRGLGRGLSALMADVATQSEASENTPERGRDVETIPIEHLRPNPNQPRRSFPESELEDLANSVREKGVLQPLIVRKIDGKTDTYEIVAGERRWRAAQIAQLHELPVLVRNYTDQEVLEIGIIENVQRQDLNPVDEAAGYQSLMDEFGHTQEKLAQALSKSRSYIANLLRLLRLPADVLELLRSGDLSAGHARALITTDSPSELAKRVVAEGLSVRETERLAKAPKVKAKVKAATKPTKDADTRALELEFGAALGLNVSIDHNHKSGGGQVALCYKNMEQLDQICQVLSRASII